MSSKTNFCVIYRFKVRPGSEETFQLGWRRVTEEIRDNRGGLGSQLHLGENGASLMRPIITPLSKYL